MVCKDCGIVVAESFIDTRSELRTFTQSERASRSRVGGSISFYI